MNLINVQFFYFEYTLRSIYFDMFCILFFEYIVVTAMLTSIDFSSIVTQFRDE